MQRLSACLYMYFIADFVANVSRSLTHFPDEHDLVGSARALLRLQDTYALDASTIAAGDIRGVRSEQTLNGKHQWCFGVIVICLSIAVVSDGKSGLKNPDFPSLKNECLIYENFVAWGYFLLGEMRFHGPY